MRPYYNNNNNNNNNNCIPSDPGDLHAVATGSAIYRISVYKKCVNNNLILILTVNPTPTITNPIDTILYSLHLLVSTLARARRSVAGFVGGALPDLELFLRQFFRMFMSLTSYRDQSSKVGFGWGIILSKDNT